MHVIILLLAALAALIAFMAISSYNETNAKGGYTVSKDRIVININKSSLSSYPYILALFAVPALIAYVMDSTEFLIIDAVFFIIVNLSFWKSFSNNSGIVIDNDGIINKTRLFMPAKRILWKDIDEIKLIEKPTILPDASDPQYSYIIKVILYDSSKYWTEKLPGFCSGALILHHSHLKHYKERDDLLKLLQNRFEKYKQSRDGGGDGGD